MPIERSSRSEIEIPHCTHRSMNRAVLTSLSISRLLFLALMSVLFQGSLLPIIAKKLDLVDSDENVLKTFNDYVDDSDMELIQITIPPHHHWVGRPIMEIELPEDSIIVTIERGNTTVIPNGKKKEWAIHWSINTGGINANQYQGSGGVGVVILFDFNKLLYENFTKRGRAIKHNRKHANAWKTYSNYLPTISDRLKLPTFYNAQQAAAAYNTTDTVTTTVSNSIPDSIKAHTPVLSTKKVTQQESSFEDYIHKQMIQDSIRRKDFFQKDKDYRNVYDIEKQIRKMKE